VSWNFIGRSWLNLYSATASFSRCPNLITELRLFCPSVVFVLCLFIKYMFHVTFSFSHMAHTHGSFRVKKTNLMHYLFPVYFFTQPLHVASVFGSPSSGHPNSANRQSAKKHNTYQLFYIYSIPPDDGLQIYPKHVEVD
jgi:hypothetical protein